MKQIPQANLKEPDDNEHQLEYLRMRAVRGAKVDIKSVLRRAPDVPPMPGDEIDG